MFREGKGKKVLKGLVALAETRVASGFDIDQNNNREKKSSIDSVTQNNETDEENIFLDQPLGVGKKWCTEDESCIVTILHQKGNWLDASLRGPRGTVLFTKEKGDLQGFLAKGGYSLVEEVGAKSDSTKAQASKESAADKANDDKDKQGQGLSLAGTSEGAVDLQQETEKPEPAVSTAKARVEKGGRTAFDRQIVLMKRELKKFEASSKQFDKIATSEQKENRAKEIEVLKRGIEDAEKKKAEWLAKEKARLEKKAESQKLVEKVKIVKPQETKVSEVVAGEENKLETVVSTGVPIAEVVEQTQEMDQQDKEVKKRTRKRKAETLSAEKVPQNGGKKNGGPAPASGFTPDEEAEQRLRAQRRAARAKEVKTVKSQEVKAPEVVADGENKPEVEKPKTEQLDLPMETPPVEKWGVSEEKLKEKPKGETLLDKIHRLNEEVAEARVKYVQEDYENTKTWKKLFSMFRIKEDVEKGEWRAEYEVKTLELQKAELEMVEAGEKDKQRDTRKEMSGLLHYYKLDERMDLINERTQYRAKNLTFWGRIGDTFGALGRGYNRIPTKYKLALSGVLIGASVATGGVLGATAYAVMMTRKAAASAGLAVGAEAGLEKLGERRRAKQTGEEIEQQMLGLDGTTNEAFSGLEEILKKDILSLDSKLQHEKRAKTYRKLAATTLGVAVGSGWLSQIIMDKLGGREAWEWAKEHFIGAELASEDLTLPERPKVSSALPEAADVKTDLIKDFVNQDIVVEKGDSVWKISERLADNLGLDGAERTHFIDALKDKFGDVQLQAGEHINFSEHGINDDFVKHAIEDSNAILPEQLERISQNNLRLTAFAEANPNVRLTDEMTKNILEGKTGIVAEQASNEFRFGQPVDLEYQPIPGGISPEDIVLEYGARADGWYDQIFKVENVQPGDRILGRDVVESLKIRDVLHDAQLFQQGASGGYTTGLSRQEIANFAKFDMNVSNGKSILFDRAGFFRNNPNATVLDYLKKVASLTRRGQKIGSFTAL